MNFITFVAVIFMSIVSYADFSYDQSVLNEECNAGVEICSDYVMGTPDFNASIGVEPQDACDYKEPRVGAPFYICPMTQELDSKGYKMIEYLGDHGVASVIEYKGSQINLGIDGQLVLGTLQEFELPSNYEPSWAYYGTATSTYEYRFENKTCKGEKCEARNVYALIFRRNFRTLSSDIESDSDLVTASVSSAMIVIKFDGLKTKIYGTVDSIAAENAGLNANQLARDCADSIVGEGNIDACTAYSAE